MAVTAGTPRPSRWRIPNGVHRGPDRAGGLDLRAVGIALDLRLDHGGGSELRPALGRRVRGRKEEAMPESITSNQVVGAAQDLAQAEFARGDRARSCGPPRRRSEVRGRAVDSRGREFGSLDWRPDEPS